MVPSHASQLIMRYTYGIDVDSCHDRYVRTAQAVMDAVSVAGKPGAWIVDALPFRMFYIFSPGMGY